jgi:hypothetical protein
MIPDEVRDRLSQDHPPLEETMAEGKGKRRDPKRSATGHRAQSKALPNPHSVIVQKTFRSPKGTKYRILKTSERDAYDSPEGSHKKRT